MDARRFNAAGRDASLGDNRTHRLIDLAQLKPQLSDFAAVVPGVDQRLQPPRRDDAGVHIDLGVRVDQGLITFDHDGLEERNGGDRGGHALDEVDAVRLCPAFEDLPVGCFGDVLDWEMPPAVVTTESIVTRSHLSSLVLWFP